MLDQFLIILYMSDTYESHALKSGIHEIKGWKYIDELVRGDIWGHACAFGLRDDSSEEIIDVLIGKMSTLLQKLEEELVSSGGTMLLRKGLAQTLDAPEYTLGLVTAGLMG